MLNPSFTPPRTGSASEMTANPPSYESAVTSQPNDRLASSDHCTLILDKCAIYSSLLPSRILYEISNPPCDAPTAVYGVQKVRYRLYGRDGHDQAELKSRLDHIYDFQNKYVYSLKDIRRPVKLQGKTSSKRSYKEVTLSKGLGGWSTCSAEGHFKAEIPIAERFGKDAPIQWKSKNGGVIALERRLKRNEDGVVNVLPRLDVIEALEEKDLDLLVSCWAARLWKEAEGDLKKPLTWEDFKRIASQKRRFGKTLMLGGDALGLAGTSAAF